MQYSLKQILWYGTGTYFLKIKLNKCLRGTLNGARDLVKMTSIYIKMNIQYLPQR